MDQVFWTVEGVRGDLVTNTMGIYVGLWFLVEGVCRT